MGIDGAQCLKGFCPIHHWHLHVKQDNINLRSLRGKEFNADATVLGHEHFKATHF